MITMGRRYTLSATLVNFGEAIYHHRPFSDGANNRSPSLGMPVFSGLGGVFSELPPAREAYRAV